MSKSVEALVEPALLVWARTSARMNDDQAASALGIDPARLQAWERGDEAISLAKLRDLARVYKRPLAVFYLPEPPREFDAMRDFRRVEGTDESVTPELAFQLRSAQQRRAIALELAAMLEERPRQFKWRTTLAAGAASAADIARKALGVEAGDHLSSRDPQKAFNGWKERAESAGILVFETKSVAVQEMRGFSIAANAFPVIGVNGTDAPAGRVFSLAHELTHLLLNEGGICEFFERTSYEHRAIERFCNEAAAELLMPQSLFLADDTVTQTRRDAWAHGTVAEVAKRFSVSREAVVVRLRALDRIADRVASVIMGEIRASYAKAAASKSAKSAPIPPPTLALKYNGRAFTRLVLRAYHRERITPVDVSDYLALKVKHLPKLEASAWGP